MRSYETVIAYHPETGETAVKELVERTRQVIGDNGGEVTRAAEWGMRDLAYRIRKQRRAYYVIVEFQGTGATVAELERNLRISEPTLRYMTTQVDPDRAPFETRPRREGGPGAAEDESAEGEERGRGPRRGEAGRREGAAEASGRELP